MPGYIPINPLDGLIVLGLLVGTAWGFNTGFFKQLVGIGCLYLAAIITTVVSPTVAQWLAFRLHLSKWITDVSIFSAIIISSYVVLWFFAKDVLPLQEEHFPGVADRLGGMITGLILASIWIGFFLILFEYTLRVRWLRWDYLRQAFLENYSSSLLTPPLKQMGYIVLYTIRPLLRGELPRMLQP